MINRLIPLFSLIILLLCALPLQGQTLKGALKDAETGEPLPFGAVALLSAADSSLVHGDASDLNGFFELKAPAQTYILQASYLGYETVYLSVGEQHFRSRGGLSVSLEPSKHLLEEITVTGLQSMFRQEIDKRVYNVDGQVVAAGGTAIDVLSVLPSIQVDEQGGISMRGSGDLLILINGRISTLSTDDAESILSQFPASSIQSIELITNPSARYDAAGVGGIINIILKEDKRRGLNGMLDLSAGTGHKYTAALNLNYAVGKLNLFSNYNYQYRELWERSESRRFTQQAGASFLLDQDFDTHNANQSHLWRSGLNWDIRPGLSAYGTLQWTLRSRDRRRDYRQEHLSAEGLRDSLVNRILTEDQRADNFQAAMGFDWAIDTNGQTLAFSITGTSNGQARTEFFDETYFYLTDPAPGRQVDQIYGRPDSSLLYILQLDYVRPLGANGRIESGLKSTLLRAENYNIFDEFDPETQQFERNAFFTNQFSFDEEIHAAYLIYRGQSGRLGYQAGLRPEWTLNRSLTQQSGVVVRNNYFNVFPSAYLSYDAGQNQTLSLNYSQRIVRPSISMLAPFYNLQDLLNLRLGNPWLAPEINDSYEMGYEKRWDQWQASATVYHRRSNEVLSRVFLLEPGNRVVQYWENANRRVSTGLELINQFYLGRSVDLSLNGNLFHSSIRGENIDENFVNSTFSWTLSLLSQIKLRSWGNLQVSGNYQGPMIMPQGVIDPIWGLNLGYRQNFLKNKLSLTLSVTDIFNTRIYRLDMSDERFQQFRQFNQETRIATLSVRYNFGAFQERAARRAERDEYGEYPF